MPTRVRKILVIVVTMAMVCCLWLNPRSVLAGDAFDVGFEDGTLDGWQVLESVDQVAVIGGDAYASAYWGDYMVVLGTPYAGVGDTQPIGANAISKEFMVLTPHMAFAYNVFTVDYPSFDRFAYLVTLSYHGTVIAEFSTTAFGSYPGGTVDSTGWRVVELDLSMYRGHELTIDIRVEGTADTKFPTWAYFDMRPVMPSMGDTMGPVITLPLLDTNGAGVADDSSTSRKYTLVTDVFDDSGWVTVGILQNGAVIAGGSTNGWQSYDLMLSEGTNDVVIAASDASGNTASRKLSVFVDSRPPDVSLEDTPTSTARAELTLNGTVVDGRSGVASLTIDGSEVPVAADGSFVSTVPLAIGRNTSTVTAVDARGNAVSWSVVTNRIPVYGAGRIAMSGTLTVGTDLGMLEGVSFPLDAAPVIRDGRVLLPIRALVEVLGGRVTWHAATRTAVVTLGTRTVALTVGSATALVNGAPVILDVAPMIMSGRTFLPLRFIAEQLGMEVSWDGQMQTVAFTYWP